MEPPTQEDHADALGVQSRGGDRGNQYQSINAISTAMVPSQEDHTEAPEKPCKSRWGVSTPVSNPQHHSEGLISTVRGICVDGS